MTGTSGKKALKMSKRRSKDELHLEQRLQTSLLPQKASEEVGFPSMDR